MSKKELEETADLIWHNHQMSTQAVASALLDLIVRHANEPDEAVIVERERWARHS